MNRNIVPLSADFVRSNVSRALLAAVAMVLATGSSALAQVKLQTLPGEASGDFLGSAVGGAGDVNGDGVADFVAGAPGNDVHGSGAGEAIVYSGSDFSVLYHFYGSVAGDEFGERVAGAGDVNADGYADIIVGSRYLDVSDASGNAVVFSGFDGSVLYTFAGTVNLTSFAAPVAGVGDVDGDGYDDVIVGEPMISEGGPNRGRARVYSGFDGSILYERTGADFEQMGMSVGAAGDVDNDGVPDFIVGSRDFYLPGRAWVYSGADGSLIHSFASTQTLDGFGASVAGVGDVNADGYDDVIVGSPSDSTTATAAGAAFVYSGANGSVLYTFHGVLALSYLGKDVAAGGDYDGDGRPDILVLLEKDEGVPAGTGSAYLYSGVNGQVLRKLESNVSNDGFGSAIDVLGDVNGDGKLDYIGGAYRGTPTVQQKGAVYVFSLEGIYSNYCSATLNSSGAPAQIHGAGYATLGNNDLVLSVTSLPTNSFGLFMASDTQGSTPLGNGTLCLAPHVYRVQPAHSSGATGTVSHPISHAVAPWNTLVQAGETWNFQYWFRDTPGGGTGLNVSDGLQVTFMP